MITCIVAQEKIEDVFAVVRYAGERTLPLTLRSLRKQLPRENIVVVEEYPFFSAVLKMFEVASSRSERFLLAVDADTLLYPNAIRTMLSLCSSQENVFRSFFQTRDIFRGKVASGQHLYRTKWAAECLLFLQEHGKPNIERPESENLRKFGEQAGINTHDYKRTVIGRHGYYQFLRHLYSVSFNRCVKYEYERKDYIALLEQYVSLHPSSSDGKIALAGAKKGLFGKEVISDARHYLDGTPVLRSLFLKERKPILCPA